MSLYLRTLTWLFVAFNSTRIFCYLPTIWVIHAERDSSQHSLWTWVTWVGANLTMGLWLYEQHGRRANRAAVVSLGNALMCAATCVLIVWYRV